MLSYRDRRRIEVEEAIRAREQSRKKAEQHWAVAFINSPFAIWLFSAIFLSVIGTIFSGIQACRSEADRAIVQYSKLETEILNRLDHLYAAILDAGSVSQLQQSAALKERMEGYTFAEFRGRTLEDLKEEYKRISLNQFGRAPLVLDEIEKHSFLWSQIMNEAPPLEGADFTRATEKDLLHFKSLASEQKRNASRARGLQSTEVYEPLCGVVTVVNRMILGTPTNIVSLKFRELFFTQRPKK